MRVEIRIGDCRDLLRAMPDESVHCAVTSPPYFGLRDYGVAGQIGLESTPDAFVAEMVAVFGEVRRVLRGDGTLWLNLGDSYNAAGRKGHGSRVGFKQGTNRASAGGADHVRASSDTLKEKDLLMIPARVALALQADGWFLRSEIIWHKPNPMPESVTDRPTSAHEKIFLLAKNARYFYDADAVKEPAIHAGRIVKATGSGAKNLNTGNRTAAGFSDHDTLVTDRNLRNVWTIASRPFKGAHFATFPPALIEPCIKAGSRLGDTILDPFGGSGTTGLVSQRLGRSAILIELNPAYAAMAQRRIDEDAGMFADTRVA